MFFSIAQWNENIWGSTYGCQKLGTPIRIVLAAQNKQKKPKQRNSKEGRDCFRQIGGYLSSMPTVTVSSPLVA